MTTQERAVAALLVELDLLPDGTDHATALDLARAVIAAVGAVVRGEAQQNVAELLDHRGLALADHPDTQHRAARLVEAVYDTQEGQ